MARRKSRPKRTTNPLKLPKNYRDDEYVPYIASAETGILEAWTIHPDLRDGDIRESLRNLMRDMKRSDQLPPTLTPSAEVGEDSAFSESEQPEDISLIEWRILQNLQLTFEKHGPLDVEDTIGILTVINHSVGTWNRGMRGQEYLKYIRDFLGSMGIEVRQLTEEEAREMEFHLPPDEDDNNLPARKITTDG